MGYVWTLLLTSMQVFLWYMVHGKILLTTESITAGYIQCIFIFSCVLIHKYHICRYACILPYGHILFSTIIHEFGKKGDLVSALTAYEASKQHLTGPNMYVYRTIIDVCGLCGDFMKSRYIYEVLSPTTYMSECFIWLSFFIER